MENVGVGLRAVATIIDSVLLFVAGYLIATLSGGTTDSGFQLQGGPFFLWLLIALVLAFGIGALAYAGIPEQDKRNLLGLNAVKLLERTDWFQRSMLRCTKVA